MRVLGLIFSLLAGLLWFLPEIDNGVWVAPVALAIIGLVLGLFGLSREGGRGVAALTVALSVLCGGLVPAWLLTEKASPVPVSQGDGSVVVQENLPPGTKVPLEIITSPTGAAITINGKPAGTSPLKTTVTVGEEPEVAASMDGYYADSTKVFVEEHQTKGMKVELSLTKVSK